MKHLPVLLTLPLLALGLLGCGDDDVEAAGTGCRTDQAGDPVQVELTMSGDVDLDRAEALVRRFNESQEGVVVALDIPNHQEPVDDLIDRASKGSATGLAAVPGDHLASLIALDAIAPMATCVEVDDYDLSPFLPEALALGQVDGAQWALPANIATHLMVFDRDAFTAAGLDPDRPPSTLAELEAAAGALQAAGVAHPISMPFIADLVQASGLPYRDHDDVGFTEAELTPIAEAVARLGARQALLQDEGDGHDELPPIGSGAAAIQVEDLAGIWGLADALADGQAPERHLDVAPLPGVERAAAPIFAPKLLVLGVDATAEQRGAAWRFVRWLMEPANVADLHLTTDLLPSRPDALEDDALTAYWGELPLLRAAWNAMSVNPVANSGGEIIPGVVDVIHPALAAIAYDGAPAAGIDAAIAEIAAAITAHDRDPGKYLACLHPEGVRGCRR